MNHIAEVIRPEPVRGFWGLFESKNRIHAPPAEAGAALFLSRFSAGADPELTPLDFNRAPREIEGTKWDLVYRVNTEPVELRLLFSELLQDAPSHSWDLSLNVRGVIKEPAKFLEKIARNWVTPGAPLTKEILAGWIRDQLQTSVQDAIKGLQFANDGERLKHLRDERALDERWWETRLNEYWLQGCGITFTATRAQWESPQADQAESARQEQQERQRQNEQRKAVFDAQLKEMRLLAEFEKERREIEMSQAHQHALTERDQLLAEKARGQQLRLLEEKYRQQLVEAEAETLRVQHGAQEAALERLVREARLQADLGAAQAAHEAQMWQTEERRRQAEQERLRAGFEIEELERRIQQDAILSAEEKKQELMLLNCRHELQIQRAKAELEQGRRDAEMAELRHQETVLEIRQQLELKRLNEESDTIHQAKARLKEASRRNEELVRQLAETQKILSELGREAAELMGFLKDKDPETVARAAAALAEFGLGGADLCALGVQVTPEQLADLLAKKQLTDKTVTLQNRRMQTRSVRSAYDELRDLDEVEAAGFRASRSIKTDPIETLRIGDSLQFDFNSRRNGHLTLINIGTSGTVFLQAPNAFSGHSRALAVAGIEYRIPGPEFLPIEYYWENGPRGVERLAVIVSREPLVSPAWVRRSTVENPIVELTQDEVAELHETLVKLEPAEWTAGMLRFRVLP